MNEEKLAQFAATNDGFSTAQAMRAASAGDNSTGRRKVSTWLKDHGFSYHRSGRAMTWVSRSKGDTAQAQGEDRPAGILTAADFDRIAELAREIVHGPAQDPPTAGGQMQPFSQVTDPVELHAHIREQQLTNSTLEEHRAILGGALRSFVDRYYGALLSAGQIVSRQVPDLVTAELNKVDEQLNQATRKIEALRPVPTAGIAGNAS